MARTDAAPTLVTQPSAAKPSLEAFFSYGFRPFFLGAAVQTVIVTAVWLMWIASAAAGGGTGWLPVAGSPFAWHAHEMIFGFAAAAVAGFLLTAVPNWTGALPLSGLPLVVLFVAWLAGRLAMAFGGLLPPMASAAIDLAFLPLLAGFAGQQLFVKPALRNLVFLIILAVLTAANAAFHAATLGMIATDPLLVMRAALLLVAVMISIIGGRIVPAFTHNWLHLNRPTSPLPKRIGMLDAASVGSVAATAALSLADISAPALGVVALAAGLTNAVRLYLWRGFGARGEPIVWILHVAYAWLVVGLLLTAAAQLSSAVPASLASHALGTGAAGTMIMAVMSRASLGHTGRPLIAPPTIVAAYGLVTLAALVRVFGPLLSPSLTAPMQGAAALCWIAAFGLFAAVYAPILTTPRVRMKTARG